MTRQRAEGISLKRRDRPRLATACAETPFWHAQTHTLDYTCVCVLGASSQLLVWSPQIKQACSFGSEPRSTHSIRRTKETAVSISKSAVFMADAQVLRRTEAKAYFGVFLPAPLVTRVVPTLLAGPLAVGHLDAPVTHLVLVLWACRPLVGLLVGSHMSSSVVQPMSGRSSTGSTSP